nr:hypothetical protein [Rhodovulum robiginosum]
MTPPTYLVLERDALISADLIQAIESRGPCRVVHYASVDEIGPELHKIRPVDAAFLEMRYDEAINSTLSTQLARDGARMVLTMGEDVERIAGTGWRLLLRPFTDEMVHQALSEG